MAAHFPLFHMKNATQLPDAMPDVDTPMLLVVCDTHHCRLMNVGGHMIMEQAKVESKESTFSDREDSVRGPSGVTSGLGDNNQAEQSRLRGFANTVVKSMEQSVRDQKVQHVFVSAPGKFLSVLKDHFPKPLQALVKSTLDGNYVKEHQLDLLVRFRPDLKKAVEALRAQENYSPKNQPPK
jgi:protein required for attachment to host cells